MTGFRRKDDSDWDDSEAAWKGRLEFVRSILEWPRYRRLQEADKGEVMSRVYERAFRFTRERVPDNERGWLTQLTYWEANRPLPDAPPQEPTPGKRDPIASSESADDERSLLERLLDLLTPGEIRFMFRTFFRLYAAPCFELLEASMEFGGLARLARARAESENTIAQRWKRCRERFEQFASKQGLDGVLGLLNEGEGA